MWAKKFEMLKEEPKKASQYQSTISAVSIFLLFAELKVGFFPGKIIGIFLYL